MKIIWHKILMQTLYTCFCLLVKMASKPWQGLFMGKMIFEIETGDCMTFLPTPFKEALNIES